MPAAPGLKLPPPPPASWAAAISGASHPAIRPAGRPARRTACPGSPTSVTGKSRALKGQQGGGQSARVATMKGVCTCALSCRRWESPARARGQGARPARHPCRYPPAAPPLACVPPEAARIQIEGSVWGKRRLRGRGESSSPAQATLLVARCCLLNGKVLLGQDMPLCPSRCHATDVFLHNLHSRDTPLELRPLAISFPCLPAGYSRRSPPQTRCLGKAAEPYRHLAGLRCHRVRRLRLPPSHLYCPCRASGVYIPATRHAAAARVLLPRTRLTQSGGATAASHCGRHQLPRGSRPPVCWRGCRRRFFHPRKLAVLPDVGSVESGWLIR